MRKASAISHVVSHLFSLKVIDGLASIRDTH